MSTSLYAYETKLMEHRALVELAEKRSQLLSTNGFAERRSSRSTALGRILGAALAFVGSLAHDSRPRLRSSEEELAALGVTWQTDPAYDAKLAQQIQAARPRRQADFPPAETAAPVPA
jgi:hypothetical protein